MKNIISFVISSALLIALLGIGVSVGFSPSAYGVNSSQLWLPKNYNRYKKELLKAVEVAEATERCLQVVAGTVSTKDSVKSHPVFKITCRDENRKTFPWLIDGISMDIINDPDSVIIAESNVIETAPKLTEEEAKIKKQLEKVWSVCSYRIKRRVENLSGITFDIDEIPEASSIENGVTAFTVNFDAETKNAEEIQDLSYTAHCHYDGQDYHLAIKPAESITGAEPVIANTISETKEMSEITTETSKDADIKTKNSSNQQSAYSVASSSDVTLNSAASIPFTQISTTTKSIADNEQDVEESCLELLKKRTAALDNVVWLPTENLENGKKLIMDFDATGPTGAVFHSRGVCLIERGKARVQVKPRN